MRNGRMPLFSFRFPGVLVCLVGITAAGALAPLSAGGRRESVRSPAGTEDTGAGPAARDTDARIPDSGRAEDRPSPAGETFPLTLTDDAGVPVTLRRKPERIISLTSFTDDILLDLVSLERLVGVTAYSQDPDISNVVDKAAAVRHKLLVNVEVILALQPDLVFVANWTDAAEVAQLRRIGIPVFLLNTGLSVEEIERTILTVARLVGGAESGKAMVARMWERLAEVESRVSSLRPDERRTVMDYTTWGSAQGRGSSWDEIVRRAGLINAVGGFAADDWGQVPLSREKMLQLDPDLLVVPGWIYGNPAGAESFYRSIVGDPALRTLRAVREARVYRMPEGLKAAASQYIADAVEYLARLAYPRLWED